MKTSLLELVEQRDRLTEETGKYYGVHELTLKENDPVKYERFYSRLHATMVAAYEVSRYVTASPGAREMGEVLWGLLTPEGDALAISAGFFSHINSGKYAIRFMAEHHYDQNPGIRDGDVFVTDDGESGGAPHPGDTYTYVPIMVGDELVAWAMGINHIMEAGAPIAGSWPGFAVDTFMDGFVVPPIKTGENLRQFTWWEQMWLRRTRAGTLNNLDDKMRLAGCAMIHREIHKIISEFGLDYYKRAIREIIEESRQMITDNVRRTMVPGRYDGAAFRAVKYKGLQSIWEHADKDQIISIRQRLVVNGDGTIDAYHDGSSHWDYHAWNGYPGGADVAFYLSMINNFAYNTKPTSAVSWVMKTHYPKHSIYNPGVNVASFSNIWAQSMALNSIGFNSVNRGRFAIGYLEESFQAEGDWEGIQGAGVLPDGTPYGVTNFENVGGTAMGAFCFRDGQPIAWAEWTQLANIGNAEEFEYLIPATFYLGRKLLPDFFGHGKYRGGPGQAILHWVVRPGELYLSRGGAGVAYCTFVAQGMSGAYPAPANFHISARGTNIYDLISAGKPVPRDGIELIQMAEEGTLKVDQLDIWRYDMPPIRLQDGDLVATCNGSSGGWGDPIERDPNLVLDDVCQGWLQPDTAKKVYGVVLEKTNEGWTIDQELTTVLRKSIYKKRLDDSVPFEEFWEEERNLLLTHNIIEPVRYMYTHTVSEIYDFDKEVKEFWQLPEDFSW
ncbi:hydantoinase [Kyrpidia spormannii]|uniref:Hydantoinase n=1 Tax=Kyrpidia spormannii TaxID=2055160 RepID=A0A2K8N7W8_9BACL|nr:hydantoinase B/oxoprolinase family protein [Kyrpidia spormannii]ATY84542.1 hydantoinase [Kyrpidia spormannii]